MTEISKNAVIKPWFDAAFLYYNLLGFFPDLAGGVFVRKKNRTFVGVNQIVITMSSQARRIELSRAKWREKTKLLRL